MKSTEDLLNMADNLEYFELFSTLDKLALSDEKYSRLKQEFILGKMDIDFNSRIKTFIISINSPKPIHKQAKTMGTTKTIKPDNTKPKLIGAATTLLLTIASFIDFNREESFIKKFFTPTPIVVPDNNLKYTVKGLIFHKNEAIKGNYQLRIGTSRYEPIKDDGSFTVYLIEFKGSTLTFYLKRGTDEPESFEVDINLFKTEGDEKILNAPLHIESYLSKYNLTKIKVDSNTTQINNNLASSKEKKKDIFRLTSAKNDVLEKFKEELKSKVVDGKLSEVFKLIKNSDYEYNKTIFNRLNTRFIEGEKDFAFCESLNGFIDTLSEKKNDNPQINKKPVSEEKVEIPAAKVKKNKQISVGKEESVAILFYDKDGTLRNDLDPHKISSSETHFIKPEYTQIVLKITQKGKKGINYDTLDAQQFSSLTLYKK